MARISSPSRTSARDGELNPVQRAMVDRQGSQCGFCTPGIVMSLYGDWLDNPQPTTQQVERTLQGQPLPLHRL